MTNRRTDLRGVRTLPLAQRRSKHAVAEIRIDPDATPPDAGALGPVVDQTAAAIRAARSRDAAVILAYGAHLVKNGLGPVVARMLSEGWVTHLATNGAGTIHDWEYAFMGRSEEDVRENVAQGCFGTWDETGRYINLAVMVGVTQGLGYGQALGRFIVQEGCELPEPSKLAAALQSWAGQPTDDPLMPARADLLHLMIRFGLTGGKVRVPHPHSDFSLTATAYRLGVPLTVHPGIGYDIIYTHPQTSGAALGRAGQLDFRSFVDSAAALQGGVMLSVGSAVMAPQIFEKAVSVANNLRVQRSQAALEPYIVVNDLAPASWNWSTGEPPPDNPAYYLRFCKSFSRMGGHMVYAQGDNRTFVHNLLHALRPGT